LKLDRRHIITMVTRLTTAVKLQGAGSSGSADKIRYDIYCNATSG